MSIAILNEDRLTTETTALLLREAGYDVIEVEDGPGLLHLIDLDRGEIDAVVINLFVPAMSGVDLFHAIRARSKTLPVVVDTGALPNSWNSAATDPHATILRKIHPAKDLLTAVARYVPVSAR